MDSETLRTDSTVGADEDPRMTSWMQEIPKRYVNAELDDLATTMDPDSLRELTEWSNTGDDRPNLLIAGSMGKGKTHAAVAACRKAHFEMGMAVKFYTADELVGLFGSSCGEVALALMSNARLVILDNLDEWPWWDHENAQLEKIVRGRWEACLPTVVTTGTTVGHLRYLIGSRTVAYLIGRDAVKISVDPTPGLDSEVIRRYRLD